MTFVLVHNVLVVLGTIGALVFAYFVQLFVGQCWKLRHFKGPLALPIVGNCYDLEAIVLLKYISKLRKRYGKIFTFFVLQKPYLVVTDPGVVRRILSDSKAFYKGTDYTVTFKLAFGDSLVTATGDKHKVRYSSWWRTLHNRHMSSHINNCTSVYIPLFTCESGGQSGFQQILYSFERRQVYAFRQ